MHRSTARALAATLVVIGGLAACGGDDPKAATPASDELKVFCEAHLAFAKGTGAQASEDSDVEALAGALVAAAPADIAPTVETFLEVAGRAAESGDDTVFVSDEFRDPATVMGNYVARNCAHHVVEISTEEYRFDGVPATLAAGPTVFHFVNEGQEIHEGLLYRMADGVNGDPIELLAADPSASSGDFEEVGVVLVGEAGDEFYITIDLAPGAYVLVCFFPQGAKTLDDLRDGGDATHDHRSAGMVVTFDVGG